MKFLADQDVYRVTINFLRERGHDVVTAREIGMHTASDEALLRKGMELDRIVLTRDKDFGSLVFLQKDSSSGVVLLRGGPLNVETIHRELETMFQEKEERVLHKAFCVVEPGRYRIRRM
jgi:predicted nuclease of predicted toxin-antitoxin system